MLISYVVPDLNQNADRKGHILYLEAHNGAICLPNGILYIFYFHFFSSEDSASYFLEMIKLIILVRTLTQTRIGVWRAHFLGMGPLKINMSY